MKTMTYSTGDALRLFPWIPRTSLFNRIEAGILPVIKEPGGRQKFSFTMAGLVHVAVTDELHTFGLWRGGVGSPEVVWDPRPANSIVTEYNVRTKGMTDDHEKACLFYEMHDFRVVIGVSLGHRQSEDWEGRDFRVFHVTLAPHNAYYGVTAPGPLAFDGTGEERIRQWGLYRVFSKSIIDVHGIWSHVVRELA